MMLKLKEFLEDGAQARQVQRPGDLVTDLMGKLQ